MSSAGVCREEPCEVAVGIEKVEVSSGIVQSKRSLYTIFSDSEEAFGCWGMMCGESKFRGGKLERWGQKLLEGEMVLFRRG